MSLLTTYSNTNKYTSTALAVRYSTSAVTGGYKYTRTATKAYKYLAMTKATAESCAAAKVAQYFRRFARYTAPGAEAWTYGCSANIAVTHEAGEAYAVTIQVNEQDEVCSASMLTSLAAMQALFKFAEVRDYDEENPTVVGIAISTATFDADAQKTMLTYAQNIPNFAIANLSVQYYNVATSSWVAATSPGLEVGYVEAVSSSITMWRLVYGSYYSNEVMATADLVLRITKASFDQLQQVTTIEYANSIPDFNNNAIRAEYLNESTGTWSQGNIRLRGDVLVDVACARNKTWRLYYNGSTKHYSNAVTTTDELMIELESGTYHEGDDISVNVICNSQVALTSSNVELIFSVQGSFSDIALDSVTRQQDGTYAIAGHTVASVEVTDGRCYVRYNLGAETNIITLTEV